MLNMANAASSQALEEGKKRLREFLEATEAGGQRSRTGEAYELRSMESRTPRKAATNDEDEDDI